MTSNHRSQPDLRHSGQTTSGGESYFSKQFKESFEQVFGIQFDNTLTLDEQRVFKSHPENFKNKIHEAALQ